MADQKLIEVKLLTILDWESVFGAFFGRGVKLQVVYKAEKSVAEALSIKEMGALPIEVTSIEQRGRALMVFGVVEKRLAAAFSFRPMGEILYLGGAD